MARSFRGCSLTFELCWSKGSKWRGHRLSPESDLWPQISKRSKVTDHDVTSMIKFMAQLRRSICWFSFLFIPQQKNSWDMRELNTFALAFSNTDQLNRSHWPRSVVSCLSNDLTPLLFLVCDFKSRQTNPVKQFSPVTPQKNERK